MNDNNREILEIIEKIENSSHDKKEILRNALNQYDIGEKVNIINFLLDIFSNKNKTTKEKINIILEYNNDYENVDKLLEELDISFIEFNSIIGDSAEGGLIQKVNRKLDKVLSEMTETVKNEKQDKTEEIILRNSQLNADAEEFAENLYKKLYKNK